MGWFGFSLICALAIPAWAQTAALPLPRFEEFPAPQIFRGKRAPPRIVTPAQRMYRTRIREGVEKGWGVFRGGSRSGRAAEVVGPNFSGKMIVVRWGCGAPCLMMAMVDAETGEVFELPLAVKDNAGAPTFGLPLLEIGNSVGAVAEVTFRLDSRLLVIRATPEVWKRDHPSYDHYFEWLNKEWRLIRRVRLRDDVP